MKTSPAAFAAAAVLLATLAVHVQASILCSEVVQDLMPCLGYLQGDDESPSAACCGGATTLYATAADTRDDRQETCECLKTAYRQYDVLVSKAQALPGLCAIGLSDTITPDIDCATIA